MAEGDLGRRSAELLRGTALPMEVEPALVAVATKLEALLRHGDALFGTQLGEAGWDVLLRTYRAGGGAISGAALASTGRRGTLATLRAIRMLADAGRLILTPGSGEAGEQEVRLAPPTRAGLETFLEDVRDAFD